jgi:hypothetical protein
METTFEDANMPDQRRTDHKRLRAGLACCVCHWPQRCPLGLFDAKTTTKTLLVVWWHLQESLQTFPDPQQLHATTS